MRAILMMLVFVSACTGCVIDEPYICDQPHWGHAYYATPIATPLGVVPANFTQTQEPDLLPAKR